MRLLRMLYIYSDNTAGWAAVFFHFYFWVIKIEEDLLEPDQKYLLLWLYNRLRKKKRNLSHKVIKI